MSALHLRHSAVPFAFVYVGETVDFRRRSVEHMLRIIGSDGVTQQPFYQVVRRGCDSNAQCTAPCESSFISIPRILDDGVVPAQFSTCLRLRAGAC